MNASTIHFKELFFHNYRVSHIISTVGIFLLLGTMSSITGQSFDTTNSAYELDDSLEKSIICTPDEMLAFDELCKLNWEEVFFDSCTTNWTKKWHLDGKFGNVENGINGMAVYAGPDKENAHHIVLWTKHSFSGDLMIEYDYQRLDQRVRQVNIIYIQATGSDAGPYKKDIFEWNDLREIPSMKTYYNNMNVLHISYAAMGKQGEYIRGRRYRPDLGTGLSGTDLGSAYNTGFFDSGVKHHICIIKKGNDLYMKVSNSEQTNLYKWNYENHPAIPEGPVGLRQMYARSSLYKNFSVKELR